MGGEMMDFRYYFLKEGTRIYEKSDLITYFKSNPYIEEQTKGDNRIYLYPALLLCGRAGTEE